MEMTNSGNFQAPEVQSDGKYQVEKEGERQSDEVRDHNYNDVIIIGEQEVVFVCTREKDYVYAPV